ncbi:MAG: TetR/AcrR family transcriptional regulator [Caulobacteraceae bacterium]|nr:TetR/AcrR family transcriptional regulator [Caulobacteraceae bacterium]
MTNPSRSRRAELRPRAEPVQARAQVSRQKVLDAAHALLKTHGARQLTTLAIAEASGVSIGAIYRFFPNKESIICRLYEEKLERIRALGLANRPGAPGLTPWRDYFSGYFLALKAAEREVDFDFSLADAIFALPELWEIEQRHTLLFADQLVVDMKACGARWSDAALFDLAVNLYGMEASTWAYWRYAKVYPTLAIERLVQATLAVMAPAMEGEPDPGWSISRETLAP